MKQIFVLLAILTTLIQAESQTQKPQTFNIEKVNFGAVTFQAKTKMRIYKNGSTAFNLPIEITSKSSALEKNEKGYTKTSHFNIRFTAIGTNKMTFSTETLSEFDASKRLTKLTEHINRNGIKQTVVCVPLREGAIEEDYNKSIGYKSSVYLLVCDNHTQKKMQSNLQKNTNPNLANLTTKKNFIMINNDIRYTIEETTKVTITPEGDIKHISSNVKAKDLFSIRYRAKDIVQ